MLGAHQPSAFSSPDAAQTKLLKESSNEFNQASAVSEMKIILAWIDLDQSNVYCVQEKGNLFLAQINLELI